MFVEIQLGQGGRAMFDYLIVGAGFAGSVLAERPAAGSYKKVLICDKRPHIGGNAYDHYKFKYLTGQEHSKTSIVYEFPKAHGDAYYPFRAKRMLNSMRNTKHWQQKHQRFILSAAWPLTSITTWTNRCSVAYDVRKDH